MDGEPLATFSFAAISWSARIKLASPTENMFIKLINCVSLYVWLPSVRDVTGHAVGCVFQ